MVRLRALAFDSLIATSMLMAGAAWPTAVAAIESRPGPTAYLDGVPIPLADVPKYHCDDFAYPVITCSASPLLQALRTTAVALLTSVDYVTIYESSNFQGGSMNISQDYPVLGLIGWNDKISSFRARNGETGRFYVDWLYGGSGWSFCCNTQQSTLGGYDNLFSSLQRT